MYSSGSYDSPTRLIGISPNNATKLERIYSKPSVKYNRPIGVNEPQLPKDDSGPQRPFVKEQLMHIKEEPMLPPRWVLEDN
ncbi:unnamed protein product [Rhizophagus irregularis]|nr:unnamed protein product [Rhizophagus irregularis]